MTTNQKFLILDPKQNNLPMHPYRQFRITLAQTTKKLVQKLLEIVYHAVIQVFTSPPPKNQESKQRVSYCLQLCMPKLPAWLRSSKNLYHAIKDFHKYRTNRTIFKLGKNRFISFGYQALL